MPILCTDYKVLPYTSAYLIVDLQTLFFHIYLSHCCWGWRPSDICLHEQRRHKDAQCWTGQFTVNQDLFLNTHLTQNPTHTQHACWPINMYTARHWVGSPPQSSSVQEHLCFCLRGKVSTEVFNSFISSARHHCNVVWVFSATPM